MNLLVPAYCPGLSNSNKVLWTQNGQDLTELCLFLSVCVMDYCLLFQCHVWRIFVLLSIYSCWAGHMRALSLLLIVLSAQVCSCTFLHTEPFTHCVTCPVVRA
jgi:hypothetical protein